MINEWWSLLVDLMICFTYCILFVFMNTVSTGP